MTHKDHKAGPLQLGRRKFLLDGCKSAAGFILVPQLLSAKGTSMRDHFGKVEYAVKDVLEPGDHAEMKGFIGKRLDRSFENRIMAQDINSLIEPFRHRTETRLWQTEFWGKWFTSAVLAYRYRPEPALKKVLQSAVEGLISTQTPDGYIGNYKNENRLE